MSVHGTRAKIPPVLLLEVFDLSQSIHPATRTVWSNHQIAKWLRDTHGIECSHDAVRTALAPLREAATREVFDKVRERMTAKLGDQLETLDDLLLKVATDARRAKTPKSRADSTDVFRKGLQVKLRYTLGEKMEMHADVTSGGATLTIYAPAKRDDGDTD